ncbi:helix-turn-helix domain-containing protein [Candidatus Pacearchaeota archaeon]|nr:helix-turn-helix domain-containing protein [Candidatus Pacearchaeota archaeon]
MRARTRTSMQEIDGAKQQFIKNLFLFSVSEAASIMGCSDRKVFDLIRDGKLLAAGGRPGNKGIRITGSSLEEYIESITIDPEFWQR